MNIDGKVIISERLLVDNHTLNLLICIKDELLWPIEWRTQLR